MKLPTEFIRLPVRFEVERLRQEVSAFAESDWRGHPSGHPGNSAIPLITVGGTDNDRVGGAMLPTPHLARCAYIRQILAQFGVVWSRTRLMRLAPGAVVPEHSDINYHWYHRVRIHIPVFTRPEVIFHCGERSVHMAAGEAWIFDNWRAHRVENGSSETRVHLVADTTGNAQFWQLAARATAEPQLVAFDPKATAPVVLERVNVMRVMHPSELDVLVADLRRDLATTTDTPEDRRALARAHALLEAFCHEWRALWTVYGDDASGWSQYETVRDFVRREFDAIDRPIAMRSNNVLLRNVLIARVLNHAVNRPDTAVAEREYVDGRRATSLQL